MTRVTRCDEGDNGVTSGGCPILYPTFRDASGICSATNTPVTPLLHLPHPAAVLASCLPSLTWHASLLLPCLPDQLPARVLVHAGGGQGEGAQVQGTAASQGGGQGRWGGGSGCGWGGEGGARQEDTVNLWGSGAQGGCSSSALTCEAPELREEGQGVAVCPLQNRNVLETIPPFIPLGCSSGHSSSSIALTCLMLGVVQGLRLTDSSLTQPVPLGWGHIDTYVLMPL